MDRGEIKLARRYEEIEEEVLKTESNMKSFARMLRELLAMKHNAAKVIVAVVITAIAGTLYPLSLGLSVNGVISGNYFAFEVYAVLFLLLFVLTFFSNRVRTVESTRLAQAEVRNLRDSAFENIQKVPISFFSKVKTGYLISRITNDGENLSDFLTFQLPQVVSGISTVVLSIVIMVFLNTELTLYALLVIPILVGFTFMLQGRVRRNYLATRKTIAAITGSMSENIGAFRAIKAYSAEGSTEQNFSVLNQNNYKSNMKAAFLSSFYGSAVNIIEAVGIVIVILAGSLELSSGAITVGILVAFILYVQQFFDPVVQLSQLYTSYQSAMVGVGRIYAIIDSEEERANQSSELPATFSDRIEFRDVSFMYDSEYALKGINAIIGKGDHIGIVGHTGAGKTTFSNLLMGFYPPTSGTLTIDGNDLREINLIRYRSMIAPVLQDIFIFRGTVFYNIKFSSPNISKNEVVRLSREFGLDSIFNFLADGLETQVGELGSNLSEGQKQAISLMRAYVRNPQILVMDEPTSQIDPVSEKAILESLIKFAKDKTLILITHRFSMIHAVDRITVIHEGEIAEEGEFSDLASSGGVFSSLYRVYNGEEENGAA